MTRSVRRHTLAAAGLLALIQAPGAWAQQAQIEGKFNVNGFSPAPGPRNFVVTRGARTDGEQSFSVGLLASYGRRPFVVNSSNPDIPKILVIENLLSAGVLASYTPIPQLQVGVHLPVTFAQGQGLTERGTADLGNEVKATGLADPELEVKFRILPDVHSPIVPAVAAFVTAPTGEATAKGAHIGREGIAGGGRAIVDFLSGPFSAAVNLGYMYQPKARIGKSEVGSRALVSAAAAFAVSPVVSLMADVHGATQFSSEAGTNPMEVDGAVRVTPLNASWSVLVGGGAGLTQGSVGIPDFRGMLGFSYAHEQTDEDGDGIPDKEDMCPAEPEDLDDYEDMDGCAEPDNDGDALPDEGDKCPNEAEDLDKFEDTDGCPELDNDKDGIPDVQDRCPDEAEVVNGYEDEDGCPDVPDTDGDGVTDADDKCPDEAEDTDGYQDTDGCPDLDNDGDGIPDDRDECVDEAETINGEDDEDGCPEDEDQ